MIELLSLQHITHRKHDILSQFSDNIFQTSNNGLCETLVGKTISLYSSCYYGLVVCLKYLLHMPSWTSAEYWRDIFCSVSGTAEHAMDDRYMNQFRFIIPAKSRISVKCKEF